MTSDDESLRERKKRQVRDALAVAALELFNQFGFDAVTVDGGAPTGDAAHRPGPRHRRERSELVRGADSSLRFRARCSCGWEGELVDIAQTFSSWDDHRRRSVTS